MAFRHQRPIEIREKECGQVEAEGRRRQEAKTRLIQETGIENAPLAAVTVQSRHLMGLAAEIASADPIVTRIRCGEGIADRVLEGRQARGGGSLRIRSLPVRLGCGSRPCDAQKASRSSPA